MLSNLQFLNVPTAIIVALIALVVVSEIIKASKGIFEFIAAHVLKIKTKAAKKKEKENQVYDLIIQNNTGLQDFMQSQTKFNEEMKAELMAIKTDVTDSMENIRSDISDIRNAQETLSATVSDMQIESMRETILEFASALSSPNGNTYTKEQFTYVKKIYATYSEILKEKKRIDDEVDLSMIIINDKYQYNVLHHTFVEDLVKNPDIKHDIDEEVEKSKTKRSTRKSKSSIEKKED